MGCACSQNDSIINTNHKQIRQTVQQQNQQIMSNNKIHPDQQEITSNSQTQQINQIQQEQQFIINNAIEQEQDNKIIEQTQKEQKKLSNLQLLIQFGRKKKKLDKIQTQQENEIVTYFENLLFEGSLTYEELIKISSEQQKELEEILLLKNDVEQTLFEEIIIYEQNFNLIKILLQSIDIIMNDNYFFIIRSLFKKIRYNNNNNSQNNIQDKIQFLKEIRNLKSIQKLLTFTYIYKQDNNQYQLLKEFVQLDSYFNLNNLDQIKLFGNILKLYKHLNIETDQLKIYKDAKRSKYFQELKLSKQFQQQSDQDQYVLLNELNYTIFHEMARKKEWQKLLQYSNIYYQYSDISGITPIMMIFQNAPLNIIKQFITLNPTQIEQALKYKTQLGQNLIHSLCLNKQLQIENEQELQNILNLLNQFDLQEQLNQPYNYQLPIVLYLNNFKNIIKSFCDFLSQYLIKQFDFLQLIYEATKLHKKDLKQTKKKKKENITEQKFDEFDYFFLHYIQLAKSVIRRNFDIEFNWINNFACYDCYYPYENLTTQTLMNLLLQQGQTDKILNAINWYQEQFLSYENEEIDQLSLKGIFVEKLITLKKELKYYPYQIIDDQVNEIINNLIIQNPRLLIQPLSSICKYNNVNISSIYGLIIDLKNDYLIQNCLTQQMLFNIESNHLTLLYQEILNSPQLNNIDNLRKKLFSSFFLEFKLIEKKNRLEFIIHNKSYQESNIQLIQILQILKSQHKFHIIPRLLEYLINNEQNEFTFNLPLTKQILIILCQHQTSLNILFKSGINHEILLKQLWYLRNEINVKPSQFPINDKSIDKKEIIIIDKLEIQDYETIFEWQINRLYFQINNYTPVQSNFEFTLKQSIIQCQIQQKIPFIIALSYFDEFNIQLESLLNNQNCKFNDLQLKEFYWRIDQCLQNQAYNNIKLISKKFQLTNIQLYEQFTQNIFQQLEEIQLKKNILKQNVSNDQIYNFNQGLKQLIEIEGIQEEQIQQETTGQFYFLFNLKYVNDNVFFSFSENTMKWMLNHMDFQFELLQVDIAIKLLEQEYNFSTEGLVLKKQLQQNKTLKQTLQMCFHDKKFYEYFFHRIKNENCFENFDKKMKNQLHSAYLQYFKINQQQALKNLNLIPQRNSDIQHFYLICLKQHNIESLNKILAYIVEENRQLPGLLWKPPNDISEDFLNYYQAFEHPFHLIFKPQQYQQFLIQIKLSDKIIYQHLNDFLQLGLYEKFQIGLKQINANNYLNQNYQEILIIFNQILSQMQRLEIKEKRVVQINLFKYESFQFNQQQDNTQQQVNQINQIEQLILIKQQQQVKNESQDKQRNKQILQLKQQIKEIIAYQNANKTSLFFNNQGQKMDFIQCANLLFQINNNIDQDLQLYQQIFFPSGIVIQNKQQLIENIFQLFQVSKYNEQFIQQRYDKYIELIQKNGIDIIIPFKIKKYISQFDRKFYLELFLVSKFELYSPNDISNLIINNQFQDTRCVQFLNVHLIQLDQFKFTSTTLYYIKNNIKLFSQQEYDLSNNKILQKKLKYLNQFINTSDFNLNKINPQQIYLLKGRQDHIQQQIEFSFQNLIASLLSNHYSTIKFILDKDNNHIYQINVFAYLLLSQCEKNIILYFNEFLKGNTNIYKQLLFINQISTIYYIIQKKYYILFQEIFEKEFTKVFGNEEQKNLIKQELNKIYIDQDLKIYQISIKQKCFFISEYWEGLFQIQDLELICPCYIQYKDIMFDQATLLTSFQINQITKLNDLSYQFISQFFNKLEFKYDDSVQQYTSEDLKLILSLETKLESDILKQIFKICLQKQVPNKYFIELIQQNPLICFEVIKPSQYTFEISIILYTQLKDNMNNFIEQLKDQLQTQLIKHKKYISILNLFLLINDDVMQYQIIYFLILLKANEYNKFDENIFTQKMLSINNLKQIIDLFDDQQNYDQTIKIDLNQILKVFLNNQIHISEDNFTEQILKEKNKQYQLFQTLYVIQQINIIINHIQSDIFIQKNIYIENFNITFQQAEITIQQDILYLQLINNNSIIQYDEKQLHQFINSLSIKIENNINSNDNQILSDDVIKTSLLEQLEMETQQFEKVGNFQISDIFAPHQIDSIEQQTSLTNLPDLQRNSSIQQMSNSLQQQQLLLSRNNSRKQELQFILELLPDNTYQVKQTSNQKHNELIFPEFYYFNEPECIINIEYQSKEHFYEQTNCFNSITILINYLYNYQECLTNIIHNKQNEKLNIIFPYTRVNNNNQFYQCFYLSYHIKYVYSKLDIFIQNLQYKYLSQKDEIKKIIWRINAISLFENIINKLVNEYYINKPANLIYQLLDSVLEWRTLNYIIFEIIYNNLNKAYELLKVIRGIYIEFNEINDLEYNTQNNQSYLDQLFQFGTTSYFLHNYILIVRLNVKFFDKRQDHIQQQEQNNSIIKKQEYNNEQFQKIINVYDLFSSIFKPDQLISFLFNKIEINRLLLNYSKRLQEQLNKTITLSIDYTSLTSSFQSEFHTSQYENNKESQLQQMNKVWYLLKNLQSYFQYELYIFLKEQLLSYKFNFHFQNRLISLLQSLNEQRNINEIIKSNIYYFNQQKINIFIKRMVYFPIQIKYYLGFQLNQSFYINNNRLGQICVISYITQGKIHNYFGQLVHTKPGFLLIKIFYDYSAQLITNITINNNQQYYQNLKESTQDIKIIEVSSIVAAVVFERNWPTNKLFNQNIINIFFTDHTGLIYQILEKTLQKKVLEILEEEDDFVKQEKMDILFGNGVTSAYSKLSLTSMTSIFPDSICFQFSKLNQLKKQQSILSGQSLSIFFNDDKFELDQFKIQSDSILCLLNSTQYFQNQLKEFFIFKNQNPYLCSIELIFDDELNSDANNIIDKLSQQRFITSYFQEGYTNFIYCEYPKLKNSLQILLNIDSLLKLKIDLFNQFINKIQLIITNNFDDKKQELIIHSDKILKIYTIIDSNYQITILDQYRITNFLNTFLIQQFISQTNLYNCIIELSDQIQNNQQQVLDICLIIRQLATFIEGQAKFILNQASNNSNQIQYNVSKIYEFQNSTTIIMNIQYFKDFSISQFILDYLNYKYQQKNNLESKLDSNIDEVIIQTIQLNQENQYQVLQNGKLEYINEINPNNFKEMILIQLSKSQIIPIKSQYYNNIIEIFQNTNNTKNIGEKFKFLISKLNLYQDQTTWYQKIVVNISGKLFTFSDLIKGKNQFIKISIFQLTNSFVEIEIQSMKPYIFQISSQIYQFYFLNQQSNQICFNFENKSQEVDLQHTEHAYVKTDIAEIKIDNSNIQLNQKNIVKNNQFIKTILLSGKNNQEELYNNNTQENVITHSNELQIGNIFTMLSLQEMNSATRAGLQRQDCLLFKDNEKIIMTQFQVTSAVFIHSLFSQIQYTPIIQDSQQGKLLIWTPTFKGVYQLFINNHKINGKFIILANTPDFNQSIVEYTQVVSVQYFDKIQFQFQLIDQYQNRYGDIEEQLYKENSCKIQVKDNKCEISSTYSKIEKNGIIKASIQFNADILQAKDIEQNIYILEISINDQIKQNIEITLQGLGLEKRQQLLQQEIDKTWKPTQYSFTISRVYFLQDLLSLLKKVSENQKSIKYRFGIKFLNEPGIDAGGLKREFYEMIGKQIKDQQYKFFSPSTSNQGQYFIDNNFNKINDKDQYALLFGQLIANAIGNSYLIGVDFVTPFWKVIFGHKIQFEDLQYILENQTYKNYQHLLTLNPQELESIYLDFTYQNGSTTIELIKNGSKQQVNATNLRSYLDKTASYIIYKQFKSIYTKLIAGFQSVLDIQILKQWLNPNEMSLLTQGLQEVTPEVILSKLKFTGGKEQHKSFFETYIYQSNAVTLKNMLKFITGSSSIPFDSSTYVLQIQFQSHLNQNRLPLGHTCFKSIEIPHYTSYSQLKQKLDIAFTLGFEGYGFG